MTGQSASSLVHSGGGFAGEVIVRLFWLVVNATWALYRRFENWMTGAKRARYGMAIGRFLLGVMMAGEALTNLGTARYAFSSGMAWSGQMEFPSSSFATIWPFRFLNRLAMSETGVYRVFGGLIVCAILFAIGFRARLMMIPLFVSWVAYLSLNTLIQDQSDNLSRIAMICLAFTATSEVWSVDAWRRRKWAGNPGRFFLVRWWRFQPVLPKWLTTLLHNAGLVAVGAQLIMVYFWGGMFKAQGSPWYTGYAVYNPIHTVQFGTWPELSNFMTTWAPMVGIASVGTILVQVSFPVMLLRRGTRIAALCAILMFHISIAVVMGLPWFSLAMVALDAVFIRDKTYREVADTCLGIWRRRRGLAPRLELPSGAIIEDASPFGPVPQRVGGPAPALGPVPAAGATVMSAAAGVAEA
jgi:hypothetical protein